MSYQALARKWRPHTFEQLVGQDTIKQAMQNALDQGRLHHAYLLTGTRGVGKTTIARILAKCLNCEQGISKQPCQTCSHCVDIDNGRHVDLIEVDAASRTKVEDTRELLDNVQYASTSGRFKIYLIDEVHMLSTHSFNALLKTLEEPPEHVKFLLATTDPEKMPVTVLSRCLQFYLKNLTITQIQDHIEAILQQETIPYEQQALPYIAQAAQGSVRDALSILDQVIAYSSMNVSVEQTCNVLGLDRQDYTEQLLTAIDQQDGDNLITTIQNMAKDGCYFRRALTRLIERLHVLNRQAIVPSKPNQSTDAALSQASPQDLQLFYQIALMGQRDFDYAIDDQAHFEMVLLRMLAFKPKNLNTHKTQTEHTNQTSSQPSQTPKPSQNTTQTTSTSPHVAESTQPPSSHPKQQQPANSSPAQKQHSEQNQQWRQMIEKLNLSGTTRLVAMHAQIQYFDLPQIQLVIAPDYAALINKRIQDRLQQALESHLKQTVKLSIEQGQPEQTPAQEQAQEQQQQQADTINNLKADPNIQAIEQSFGVDISQDATINRNQ